MIGVVDFSLLESTSGRLGVVLTRATTLWMLRAVAVLVAIGAAGAIPLPLVRAYVVLGVGACGLLVVQLLWRHARSRREVRLRHFAELNGLKYLPRNVWKEPSALLNRATNTRIVDEFSQADGDETVRVGTLVFGTERASVKVDERWAFLSRNVLGAPLPHIVLLSKDARARSLPVSLDNRQKLLLEGDFQTYFDVYCAAGAEREALYILTPDLMASLADRAGFSSMEILDNTVMFFAPGRFDPEDSAQWRRLQALSSSVADDAIKRVRRFNRVEDGNAILSETLSGERTSARLITSTGRSNRSTWIVEAACAVVVAAAILWAAIR